MTTIARTGAGQPVVVIGAGLAGLAAACHLQGAGYQVTVIEREPIPGGRAGRYDDAGFSFDTGPTVMTMPDLVADALRAVGAELSDVLPMTQLDPAYRACFADGSAIMVRSGHEAMRAEIEQTCGSVDAAAFDEFVIWLRRLYLAEMPHFIDHNFDSPLGLLHKPSAAATLLRLGAFGKLGNAVRRRFADPRLHRLFSFQAMYAGLAPDDALALYAVITYMDSINGVYFPVGGMHAIPSAMALAAEKAGVEFRYGETASEIVRRPGSSRSGGVAGVRLLGGEQLRADAVVCTLDLPIAYDRLLPDLTPPKALASGHYSPSCVVWHVGVRGLPKPPAAHHNIHFGTAWGEAFDDLLKRGALMRDPSRLVTIPTIDEPSLAPEGNSTLFVLEPTPNLSRSPAQGGLDWKAEAGPMRDRLHAFLGEQGYPTDVVTEQLITPLEWEAQGMAQGTPFALAHTFPQTGPFRPKNVERRVPGMIFAGSNTTPGVGVPMVLVSGKLAAARVSDYLGAR